MSPVAMCRNPKSACRRSACVPFPAPGGPSMTRFNSDNTPRLLQEALVTSHHQLRLELLHRFERDADHDQDRGPAEVEVLVRAREQDRGQRRYRREEQRTWERQAREDAIEEFRPGGAGPTPGNEPPYLS